MFAAVQLGVFDRTPGTLDDLAAVLSAHSAALERLLDGCVGLGFLRKDGGRYTNTPVADTYLRRSSPQTLAGYVLYSNQVLFRMWAKTRFWMARTSGSRHSGSGGRSSTTSSRRKGPRRDFLSGMHGFGLLSSPAVAAAF
jgi:acetylserotonin N-methyltransferase